LQQSLFLFELVLHALDLSGQIGGFTLSSDEASASTFMLLAM